tara:strand:+ start:827 stop:1174 length:348 start_codon:yes stop_codon:yes gene_type:complete
MTNLSVLAQGNTNATPNEGNGTSGPLAAGINADADKVLLPLATVTGTLAGSNKYATHATANLKGSAIRHSVAKTKSGAAASEVYSETLCFRTSYSGQECDSPAINEASGDANRAA